MNLIQGEHGAGPGIRYIYDMAAWTDPRSNTGSVGNLRKIEDPEGFYSTEFSCYDETEAFPTMIINAAGHKVTGKYNELGKISWERDPNGNTTRYDYDALGRRERMTNQVDFDKESTYGTVQNNTTAHG